MTTDSPVVSATEVGTLVSSMSDVLDKYDIVSVVAGEPGTAGGAAVQPFMVVSPRPTPFALSELSGVDLRELGTSSPSPFTSFMRKEYNRELEGTRGLQKYDQMRRSDGTVRGTLRLVKTPVLAARWFMEPAASGPNDTIRLKDKKIAEFVWKCLNDYMSISFQQMMQEALLMCEFGYYMFEKVWENRLIEGRTRTVWKKLAPRHPMDVKEWHFDSHGGPAGVTLYPTSNPLMNDVTIGINKLLVFTFDKEAGNIEGISLLRSMYKHWYYKDQLYKIDAIQKERHGIGIPMITLPPGFSSDDKNLAENMGRNLRTNERAHVVLPPNWELVMLKLEGQPVDCLKSIEHHDLQIQKSILADEISGKGDEAMFLKATRFIADIVCQTFNDYAIPELVDFNFPNVKSYPKLTARRIGESADWRTQSFAIRNFIGAGVIQPDDVLERNIRKEMDLPPLDEATIRKTETPQGPPGSSEAGKPGTGKAPEAGPPRQTPAKAQLPAGNAGTDRSGK
jgi:hypothetical protein